MTLFGKGGTEMDRGKEELLQLIRQEGAQLGHPPKPSDMGCADEIRTQFGSWKNALSEAGYIGKWTLEEFRQEFDRQVEERHRPPTISEFQPFCQCLMRKFGSWSKALEAMNRSGVRTVLSEAQMIALLREKAEELGVSPARADVEHGNYIFTHLGGGNWNDALRKASLQPQRNLSDEELLGLLRDKAAELGHVPVAREMAESFRMMRRFGSWNKALKQAGLYTSERTYERTTKKTDAQIRAEIEALYRKLKRAPKFREYPHAAMACKRLGPWSKIVEEASHGL